MLVCTCMYDDLIFDFNIPPPPPHPPTEEEEEKNIFKLLLFQCE